MFLGKNQITAQQYLSSKYRLRYLLFSERSLHEKLTTTNNIKSYDCIRCSLYEYSRESIEIDYSETESIIKDLYYTVNIKYIMDRSVSLGMDDIKKIITSRIEDWRGLDYPVECSTLLTEKAYSKFLINELKTEDIKLNFIIQEVYDKV